MAQEVHNVYIKQANTSQATLNDRVSNHYLAKRNCNLQTDVPNWTFVIVIGIGSNHPINMATLYTVILTVMKAQIISYVRQVPVWLQHQDL